MQLAFRIFAVAALASCVLFADSMMKRMPLPRDMTGSHEMRLVPATIDSRDLPRGWTLKGAWRVAERHVQFRGISGLDFRGDWMIAVTDNGLALGFPAPTGPGRIPVRTRIASEDMRLFDAESVVARDGALWVGYETRPRLVRIVRDAEREWPLPGFSDDNHGAEAMFDGRRGLTLLGEDGTTAVRLDRATGKLSRLAFEGATWSPTGAAAWPDRPGGLLLQRRLGLRGFEAGVAGIEERAEGIRIGAMRRLGLAWNDNAEGIAVRARPGGGYEVWIVTDDNNRAPQRTIFVHYDLEEDAWPFTAKADAED